MTQNTSIHFSGFFALYCVFYLTFNYALIYPEIDFNWTVILSVQIFLNMVLNSIVYSIWCMRCVGVDRCILHHDKKYLHQRYCHKSWKIKFVSNLTAIPESIFYKVDAWCRGHFNNSFKILWLCGLIMHVTKRNIHLSHNELVWLKVERLLRFWKNDDNWQIGNGVIEETWHQVRPNSRHWGQFSLSVCLSRLSQQALALWTKTHSWAAP